MAMPWERAVLSARLFRWHSLFGAALVESALAGQQVFWHTIRVALRWERGCPSTRSYLGWKPFFKRPLATLLYCITCQSLALPVPQTPPAHRCSKGQCSNGWPSLGETARRGGSAAAHRGNGLCRSGRRRHCPPGGHAARMDDFLRGADLSGSAPRPHLEAADRQALGPRPPGEHARTCRKAFRIANTSGGSVWVETALKALMQSSLPRHRAHLPLVCGRPLFRGPPAPDGFAAPAGTSGLSRSASGLRSCWTPTHRKRRL